MHHTKAVGNWFLQRFWKAGRLCTQLQLNKLVYIAHGWHLAADQAGDGFIDDKVIAWKYGPVIPSLREEFRDYGSSPIARLATSWSSDGFRTPQLGDGDNSVAPWETEMAEWVWTQYGHLTGGALIDLTHRPGTPWAIVTRNGMDIGFNREIERSVIRDYYSGLLERLRQGG